MKALKATEHIWWVGALDPDLRVFDIVMHSDYGTTYNSYLVRGKQKTALFETVKEAFFEQQLEEIRSVMDPAEIDYIVVDHTEPDHSGSIRKMLQLAPNATVLGSATAISFLKEIINEPFNHRAVTEKDSVDLGGLTLQFIAAPMLHWPDSMYTYIPEKKALFSCDSFGCHYSDKRVFNDLIDGDFTEAYRYYFDNIIGPYKNPHMLNALKKIENLPIEFIGNGHGPVLRSNIPHYLELYRQWSAPTQSFEPMVAVCYVSAYGYTKLLAKHIEQGLLAGGIRDVRSFDLVKDDAQAAQKAVCESDGFLLGSPTILGDSLPPINQLLVGLNPVIHRGKLACAFGSYAWSGEGVPNLTARMETLRLKQPIPGLKVRLRPTEADLAAAEDLGRQFANALLNR
ncbi:FprA family A-type flavoprotein [Acidaminobacterium chupaoyuni]